LGSPSPPPSSRRKPGSSAYNEVRARHVRSIAGSEGAEFADRLVHWIPAFAGMTPRRGDDKPSSNVLILRCERSGPRRTLGDTPRVVRGSPSGSHLTMRTLSASPGSFAPRTPLVALMVSLSNHEGRHSRYGPWFDKLTMRQWLWISAPDPHAEGDGPGPRGGRTHQPPKTKLIPVP